MVTPPQTIPPNQIQLEIDDNQYVCKPGLNISTDSMKIQGILGGQQCTALIDTGAEITCLGTHFLEKLEPGSHSISESPHKAVMSVDGTESHIVGEISSELEIEDNCFSLTAQITNLKNQDIILGRDFLKNAGASVDFRNESISFRKKSLDNVERTTNHGNFPKSGIGIATVDYKPPPVFTSPKKISKPPEEKQNVQVNSYLTVPKYLSPWWYWSVTLIAWCLVIFGTVSCISECSIPDLVCPVHFAGPPGMDHVTGIQRVQTRIVPYGEYHHRFKPWKSVGADSSGGPLLGIRSRQIKVGFSDVS